MNKLLAKRLNACGLIFMIDNETASLKPNAAITSIGMVPFMVDLDGQITSYAPCYYVVDTLEYMAPKYAGKFVVDQATLDWRAANLPEEKARNLLPIQRVAADINCDIGTAYQNGTEVDKLFVMSKPTKFDLPQLENFFEAAGEPYLFSRHRVLDLESICWSHFGDIKAVYEQITKNRQAHHALEDCYYQLDVLQFIINNS